MIKLTVPVSERDHPTGFTDAPYIGRLALQKKSRTKAVTQNRPRATRFLIFLTLLPDQLSPAPYR
jgi:hypothetical protein